MPAVEHRVVQVHVHPFKLLHQPLMRGHQHPLLFPHLNLKMQMAQTVQLISSTQLLQPVKNLRLPQRRGLRNCRPERLRPGNNRQQRGQPTQ